MEGRRSGGEGDEHRAFGHLLAFRDRDFFDDARAGLASTLSSIFIASSTTSVAPRSTLSPLCTAALTTLPGSGAVTRVSVASASPSSTAWPGRVTDQARPSWSTYSPPAAAFPPVAAMAPLPAGTDPAPVTSLPPPATIRTVAIRSERSSTTRAPSRRTTLAASEAPASVAPASSARIPPPPRNVTVPSTISPSMPKRTC